MEPGQGGGGGSLRKRLVMSGNVRDEVEYFRQREPGRRRVRIETKDGG